MIVNKVESNEMFLGVAVGLAVGVAMWVYSYYEMPVVLAFYDVPEIRTLLSLFFGYVYGLATGTFIGHVGFIKRFLKSRKRQKKSPRERFAEIGRYATTEDYDRYLCGYDVPKRDLPQDDQKEVIE